MCPLQAEFSHVVCISCQVQDFKIRWRLVWTIPNTTRMGSVTQFIAGWWLRAVWVVSSVWFMDTVWTRRMLSSEQKPGLFFFFCFWLPAFSSNHAKVFRTTISLVLIWVRGPLRLAKPLIIRHSSSTAVLSQVVFLVVIFFTTLLSTKWEGDTVVLKLPIHPSICHELFCFSTGVKEKRKCRFYMAHLSSTDCTE